MADHELTIMCNHSNFKIFNVATTFTPAMVIENVLGGKAEPKGWAVTEVVEKGDGAWAKVRDTPFRVQCLVDASMQISC